MSNDINQEIKNIFPIMKGLITEVVEADGISLAREINEEMLKFNDVYCPGEGHLDASKQFIGDFKTFAFFKEKFTPNNLEIIAKYRQKHQYLFDRLIKKLLGELLPDDVQIQIDGYINIYQDDEGALHLKYVVNEIKISKLPAPSEGMFDKEVMATLNETLSLDLKVTSKEQMRFEQDPKIVETNITEDHVNDLTNEVKNYYINKATRLIGDINGILESELENSLVTKLGIEKLWNLENANEITAKECVDQYKILKQFKANVARVQKSVTYKNFIKLKGIIENNDLNLLNNRDILRIFNLYYEELFRKQCTNEHNSLYNKRLDFFQNFVDLIVNVPSDILNKIIDSKEFNKFIKKLPSADSHVNNKGDKNRDDVDYALARLELKVKIETYLDKKINQDNDYDEYGDAFIDSAKDILKVADELKKDKKAQLSNAQTTKRLTNFVRNTSACVNDVTAKGIVTAPNFTNYKSKLKDIRKLKSLHTDKLFFAGALFLTSAAFVTSATLFTMAGLTFAGTCGIGAPLSWALGSFATMVACSGFSFMASYQGYRVGKLHAGKNSFFEPMDDFADAAEKLPTPSPVAQVLPG